MATQKRTWWQFKGRETGRTALLVDFDEIVAVNVPDVGQDGCWITLRSGQKIHCPNWSPETREANIKFFLEQVS